MPRAAPGRAASEVSPSDVTEHRAALLCSSAYPVMTTATMTIMPNASRSAAFTLASPTCWTGTC